MASRGLADRDADCPTGYFAWAVALQLAAGPLGERLDPHRRQQVVGRAKLLARIDTPGIAEASVSLPCNARSRSAV